MNVDESQQGTSGLQRSAAGNLDTFDTESENFAGQQNIEDDERWANEKGQQRSTQRANNFASSPRGRTLSTLQCNSAKQDSYVDNQVTCEHR